MAFLFGVGIADFIVSEILKFLYLRDICQLFMTYPTARREVLSSCRTTNFHWTGDQLYSFTTVSLPESDYSISSPNLRRIGRVPFGIPIFTDWLRENDPELSFPKKFLYIFLDYDWTCEKFHQSNRSIQTAQVVDVDIGKSDEDTDESIPYFTLSDFGRQFLWESLLSLHITSAYGLGPDEEETDSFAILLANTCPNLMTLQLFFEKLSASAFKEVVLNCPHIETLVLGIETFDYDAALSWLGKSPRYRPMNICFHLSVLLLPTCEPYWPIITAQAIEAFASSNVELSSFAVFFMHMNYRSRGIIDQISNGVRTLKDIRSFSTLNCPDVYDCLNNCVVVGACRRLVFFVPTPRRYRFRCNDFFRHFIMRFTVDGEENEENDEVVGVEDVVEYELIDAW
jgi:hypothetical protein